MSLPVNIPQNNNPTSVLPNNTVIIPVDIAPLQKIRTYFKRINTTNQIKQSKPDLRIANPYNISAKIYSIAIIPDSTAQTKLFCQILLDDDELLYVAGGDMADTSVINVPIPIQGKSIDKQKYIDVFIWTSDGSSSNLSVSSTIGVS